MLDNSKSDISFCKLKGVENLIKQFISPHILFTNLIELIDCDLMDVTANSDILSILSIIID